MGELDQALFMYLDGQDHHSSVQDQQRQTLNIFPSQPINVEPSTKVGMSFLPPSNNSHKMSQEPTMELGHPRRIISSLTGPGKDTKVAVNKTVTKEGGTSSSEHEGPKTPDPKTLRRLAQNREAARKSRLRRKMIWLSQFWVSSAPCSKAFLLRRLGLLSVDMFGGFTSQSYIWKLCKASRVSKS